MNQIYLQKATYEQMMEQIKKMSKEDIDQHLHALGCTIGYDVIADRLSRTYNELAVSDMIFSEDKISDEHCVFPKTFIDEAVLEIAKRENYPFTHYGIISEQIAVLMERHQVKDAQEMLTQFRLLFKSAKHFAIPSIETMIYQVNDGVDMFGAIVAMLDIWMIHGRSDTRYYKEITSFVDKFLTVFPKTSDVLKVTLLYEQAQAYIAMKSSKGEQLFQRLLKTHKDPTDVVLHYALAYLDEDEKKAAHILKRYHHLLDENSESYAIIEELKEDMHL